MEKIDFILTWVDGEDSAWIKQRAKYDKNGSNDGNKAVHYRDYGTLKYWFRMVEKYAPWVNKVHFVTCGQKPEWLDETNPKLNLVNHSDFMDEKYLPTFSINPIELNFHNIKGLEEQFVYFNDDTFICAPVKESDFFKKNLPCDSFESASLIPSVKNEVITYILFNDLLLLNSNHNKKSLLKKNFFKWTSLRYGKSVFRNLYHMPVGKFGGFINPHLPNSFLKSTYQDVWDKEQEYLSKICENKFRTKEDVNQYLIRYWQLVTGKFAPRSPKIGKCFVLGDDNTQIKKHLNKKSLKLICINDNPNQDKIDEQISWLQQELETLFPEKCSFEK